MVLTRRLRLVILSLLVAMNGLDLSVSGLLGPLGQSLSGEPHIAALGSWGKGSALQRDPQHDEVDEDATLADPDRDDLDDDDVLLASRARLAPKPEVEPWSGTSPPLLGFPRTNRLFRPPRALVS